MNALRAFSGRARALPAPPAKPSGHPSAGVASLPLALLPFVLATLAIATVAAAQSAEPKGPADIIGGAQRSRATRELEQAGARAQGGPENPHAPAGHPGLSTGSKEPPPIASDRAEPLLATGTIQVQVYDRGERPAANAEVSLGVMAADGGRSSIAGRTDASGIALFSGLAVGDKQAYRVNVPYRGAKYSSNPFRLAMTGGHRVEIRRAPVTRDARMVVLYVGATSLELKDERIKVVQQSRLLNLGSDTYVFPDKGTLVRLPEGFMAVQTEETMGDQRIEEQAGEGLRVRGSLPPGEVTLLWGFDLPLSGTEARFTIEVPWLTFAYRVIADAPESMSLSVEGMPEPQLHEDGGRRFLVTEVQRKVGDTPFRSVQVTLRGIPGPGPGRFIAAGLALLVVAGGVVIARRTTPGRSSGEDFASRKAELLERARAAAAQHAAGEVGPRYYEERLHALEDELAALLLEEQRSSPAR